MSLSTIYNLKLLQFLLQKINIEIILLHKFLPTSKKLSSWIEYSDILKNPSILIRNITAIITRVRCKWTSHQHVIYECQYHTQFMRKQIQMSSYILSMRHRFYTVQIDFTKNSISKFIVIRLNLHPLQKHFNIDSKTFRLVFNYLRFLILVP